jgi:hypothetical protein
MTGLDRGIWYSRSDYRYRALCYNPDFRVFLFTAKKKACEYWIGSKKCCSCLWKISPQMTILAFGGPERGNRMCLEPYSTPLYRVFISYLHLRLRKYCYLYENRNFIAMFTRARHRTYFVVLSPAPIVLTYFSVIHCNNFQHPTSWPSLPCC